MNMKKLMIASAVVFSLSFATSMAYAFQASSALETPPVAETTTTEEPVALASANASLR
ncbi:unknown [Firmicutes bacterium CAG:466]|nr:unknown [Firmicutes bacterium CAG:466]